MALFIGAGASWHPLKVGEQPLLEEANLLKSIKLKSALLALELRGARVQATLEKREISPIVRGLREVPAI
ncbi:MAG: hypothetical protein ACO3T7_03200 [Pseudomonadales bacterium]